MKIRSRLELAFRANWVRCEGIAAGLRCPLVAICDYWPLKL